MKSRVKLLGLLSLLPAGCGDHLEKYPQTIYAPASDYAEDVLWLQNYITVLGVVVGVLIFAIMAFILFRFRHRPGSGEPEQVQGNTRLELAWTLIPAVILAFVAVPTVQSIFATQPNIDELPANTLPIDVIGWQWWWEFRYTLPGGETVITANEIHVPVGTPILLRMTARDVLHSFWVPQMGGKRDLMPNRTNYIYFTPQEPGIYLGQCAEYCGDSHALMRMRLIAHAPDAFAAWLRNEASPAVEPLPQDSALLLGKQFVTQGACAGCHTIDGTQMVGRLGPDLTHFGRRRTLAAGILENNAVNLTAWLHDAPAIKPGSKMPAIEGLGITEEQVPYVVAYLQSLQ